ncbi:pyridoxal phosphate-dependent transferase [Flagelloscypha sp. PMI_526]|nr:pyridoxal phosphate-dependent transferase [Flagelloscypha sp. PMI_526]
MNVETGQAVPPLTAHAISVSLPKWADNVAYEEGDERLVKKMVSGYPRFFIHLSIVKLAQVCSDKFATQDERCMLFPTKRIADLCRTFIQLRSDIQPRLVHLFICPESPPNVGCADLHIVLFPSAIFPIAKQFWQHTGLGISSRLAENCLRLLELDSAGRTVSAPASPTLPRSPFKALNRHYGATIKGCAKDTPSETHSVTQQEDITTDHSVYLEERYGRNLPLSFGPFAKRAMRRRIAQVLVHDPGASTGSPRPDCEDILAGKQDALTGPSKRGVSAVTEDDVFLYPCGMAAIWSAHELIRAVRPDAKSVCFGFPYTDTLKVLEKWGPGCHFLGNGLDSDIETLEEILESGQADGLSQPPILALFTEFPSNPLLRSANLSRLRKLADRYNFLIVVDETLGNYMNVEVLPYADIVVSSLSKVFSGDANTMGGSLVLNPHSLYYKSLKGHLSEHFEDSYFDQDAIFMERNSRDFARRTKIIDTNTEAVCDLLRSRSVDAGAPNAVVRKVFYPKWETAENYEMCRVKARDGEDGKGGAGYGGLFSLDFTSMDASRAFFDKLEVLKGPSLGTNFTLACPYTILAHYTELDWAKEFGVDAGLVRVSVGMENLDGLLDTFMVALQAAEATVNPS